MTGRSVEGLGDLPPLWETEARETSELILPLRFSCPWHRLTWFPVERTGDVLYGLCLHTVPEWRHFSLSELMARYRGQPVLIDRAHHPAPVPQVPEVRAHALDDLSPFIPTRPQLP